MGSQQESQEPTADRHGLSGRSWENVSAIMPKIKAAVQDRVSKESTFIDLGTAENWLLRPELIELCKKSISEGLEPHLFSYPKAFAGYPNVLEAFASFFNSYFKPFTPVEVSHLACAPGAASCLDTLFYNICDPGDAILLAGPYWSG
jgi:gliotoxin/aspirochlorine biosynthesis aminotransferase